MSGYKNAPFKLSTYCCIAAISSIFIVSFFYFKNIGLVSVGISLLLWMSFRYLRNGHQD